MIREPSLDEIMRKGAVSVAPITCKLKAGAITPKLGQSGARQSCGRYGFHAPRGPYGLEQQFASEAHVVRAHVVEVLKAACQREQPMAYPVQQHLALE